MIRVRTALMLGAGIALLVAACSSVDAMTDDALAVCTEAARVEGSIGGSGSLLPTVVLRLPEEAIAPEGSSAEDIEAAFDDSFNEIYGIHVDEFLSLRDDADAVTTAQHGEPPGIGEQVSDEWFVERDAELMKLWNERHPESARRVCELVVADMGVAP